MDDLRWSRENDRLGFRSLPCCNSRPRRNDRPSDPVQPGRTHVTNPNATDTDSIDEKIVREDYEIVRGFVEGNRERREGFAIRLKSVPRMAACVNRRTGGILHPDEVADLAQDAVLIALRKAESFRSGIILDAWLYRIVGLEMRNFLRRRRRRSTVELSETEHASSNNEGIDDFERRDRILGSLARLHAKFAVVIRLHKIEGLSFAEVGARIGVTENTAKGRYYRGIAELAVLLRHG